MGNNVLVLALILVLLVFLGSYSSPSATSSPATSPVGGMAIYMSICADSAEIVSGFFSNAVSVLMKWLWSLKATTKTALSGRPMMKFESGYIVETVFDGSKLGIEPYSVEVLPGGELLVLDSVNNNLYRISTPLSQFNRPKLVAGSAEGYSGHVDGKPRGARMNNPKALTLDDRGNIYVADTENMAIRKISDAGVTTIAGGKWGRRGGHLDGPSEEAKFSNDFDVVYIGSSCSLLVIDRGNQAIREIQLHFDDCAYQYGSGFPLGIVVLVAAGFFGYMLALLQSRVGTKDQKTTTISQSPFQKALESSVSAPLIPTEDEQEKQESFFGSLGRLLINAGASVAEIFGGIFPWCRRKPQNCQNHSQQPYQPQQKYSNTWPVQASFVIPDEDEPPSMEPQNPTPRKTYAFMTKDAEKMQQLRQSRAFYGGWDGDLSSSNSR
ncbi:unnamed protein product [Ilex paraguariensis]|uniref:NHL repeat-containing protein n=1 Tax=Ilex paraguariensis TaxID=185542 RepID=A0ABC8R4E2_9AQUA